MCQSVNRRGRAAASALLGGQSTTAAAAAATNGCGEKQPIDVDVDVVAATAAQAVDASAPAVRSSAPPSTAPTTRILTGDLSQRQPTAVPPFTIGTLRKAIPPHCFERSTLKSSLYLGADVALAALLGFAAAVGIPSLIPESAPLLRGLAWLAYWWLQGAVCTGIWVCAHECGHQAFSPSQKVNDGVGLVAHSLLLVPYYSWKHSHRRHHSNTGSVDRDEVFVPPVVEAKTSNKKKNDDEKHHDDDGDGDGEPLLRDQLLASAPGRLLSILFALTMGWPAYLFFNVSGRNTFPEGSWPNHFWPSSPIFTSKREKVEVAVSDAALAVVGGGLYYLAKKYGLSNLAFLYFVPYLVVNAWLVTITLLQHTHPALPHYRTESW